MTAKDTKRAIFLDRDGCISPDKFGYISDPDQYSLYPYTGEALRILQELGYQLFVVTNQSGIARGYFDVPALEKVLGRMRDLITAEGVKLTGVYYSPWFAEGSIAPFNVAHEDRKPGLGMFKRALREHPFDINKSWMMGDRKSDIEFGRKAGLQTVLLLSGNGAKEMMYDLQEWKLQPDFMAENLLTAARLIQMLYK